MTAPYRDPPAKPAETPKPKTEIPKHLQKPGLVWGEGKEGVYVYAESRALLSNVPDKIGHTKVIKRVTGKVRPARRR